MSDKLSDDFELEINGASGSRRKDDEGFLRATILEDSCIKNHNLTSILQSLTMPIFVDFPIFTQNTPLKGCDFKRSCEYQDLLDKLILDIDVNNGFRSKNEPINYGSDSVEEIGPDDFQKDLFNPYFWDRSVVVNYLRPDGSELDSADAFSLLNYDLSADEVPSWSKPIPTPKNFVNIIDNRCDVTQLKYIDSNHATILNDSEYFAQISPLRLQSFDELYPFSLHIDEELDEIDEEENIIPVNCDFSGEEIFQPNVASFTIDEIPEEPLIYDNGINEQIHIKPQLLLDAEIVHPIATPVTFIKSNTVPHQFKNFRQFETVDIFYQLAEILKQVHLRKIEFLEAQSENKNNDQLYEIPVSSVQIQEKVEEENNPAQERFFYDLPAQFLEVKKDSFIEENQSLEDVVLDLKTQSSGDFEFTGQMYFDQPVYRLHYEFELHPSPFVAYRVYFPSCKPLIQYETVNLLDFIPKESVKVTDIVNYGGSLYSNLTNTILPLPLKENFNHSICCFLSVDEFGFLCLNLHTNALVGNISGRLWAEVTKI